VVGAIGAFEIIVDGRAEFSAEFSKAASGRFPTDAEIDALATG